MRNPITAVGAALVLTAACTAPAQRESADRGRAAPATGTTAGAEGTRPPRPQSAPARGGGSMAAEPSSPAGPSGGVRADEAEAALQRPSGSRYEGQLDQTWNELERTLGLSRVDCGRARRLRDRICDLAERICDIARDHPGDDDVQRRCEDGRQRCERAREDVESECGR